jgi:hypothetical protein
MPATSSTILEPQLASQAGKRDNPIECSVHTLPKPLMKEFLHVFGETYLPDRMQEEENNDHDMELLAIPTNQQARNDLVGVGEEIEQEKDRLLNVVSSLWRSTMAFSYWRRFLSSQFCYATPDISFWNLEKNCA